MTVPRISFVDLKAQRARLEPEMSAAIARVLEDGRFVMGPDVLHLEEELATFVGGGEVITTSSGTDALFVCLLALGIGPGDAVFVPSFTYTATAEVILLAGATPVFVDVEEDTFAIAPDDLAARIAATRSRTSLRPACVIPVDLFGLPADYDTLGRIAEEHGLALVADAAQGLGGQAQGRRVGSLAPYTATSFFPSKPLGCYGDGGAIFTDDPAFADRLRSIRAHGRGADKYDIVRVGVNARLDTIQAAVLRVKLKAFEGELAARERVADAYDAVLCGIVETPARVPGLRSAWAQYTIRCDERDGLKAHLESAGIPTMVFYPRPMHLQPAYAAHGEGPGSLPVSEGLCRRVLSLPMHPDLEAATARRIANAVREYFGR